MAAEGEPVHAENPCNSGYYFSSVIGFGEVVFIEDDHEKCDALSILFRHQAGGDVTFTAEQEKNHPSGLVKIPVNNVCVFKIISTDFTGKKKPRPNA